ncbi:MAG: hypothetical protein HDR01_05235 [Lachnospiraceae bacterium]|nr:hypothetical protein [Lachnospiraceae bacterium]
MKQKKLEALFYSLLTVCATAVLAAGYLYGKSPVYEEFVTGVTTWSGYPKKADMQMVQLFLLGIPACFFLFQAILKREEGFSKERKQAALFLKAGYVIFLCSVFSGKDLWKQWGLLLLFCLAAFLILGKNGKHREYVNMLLTGLFSYLSITAAVVGSTFFLSSYEKRLFLQKAAFVLQAVSLLVPVLYGILIRKQKEVEAEKLFCCSRLLLPLCFLGFFTFYYSTEEGTVVQLFYSGSWKGVCLLLGVGMTGYEAYRLFRKNYDISWTTVVSVGLLRIFHIPEGMLNVDFFHMGEMTLPMQQLFSYGKVPYGDLVPIHGMCDYFYQIWNYLFFDGTYLSFNGALVVGNIIFVIAYGILFYHTIENKKTAVLFMYVFIPFFVDLAGMRYLFVFALFFLLFSQQAKRSSLDYLWWWVLLSIFAIGWNASLGGAAALGFLPSVLYRVIRDIRKELPFFWKEKRKKLLICYGMLFVIGICFIPMFIKIVVYLRENAGTTLYVNGMEMLEEVKEASSYFVPGLVNAQGTFFLKAFCVLAAIGICLYYSAYIEAVVLVLSSLVLANYAYVRYEEGLRAKILGIFFLLLVLCSIMEKKAAGELRGSSQKAVYLLMAGFLAMAANDTLLLTRENVLPTEELPAALEISIGGKTVEDPIVYISGEQTGLKGIGTGFVRGNTLNSLSNIEYVLSQSLNGESAYLDLTNGIAQTVILDRELGMSYTSGYNISNELLNEHAIAELKKNPPQLILVAPYIKLDDVPLSLRAMKLYEYVLEEGYQPYQYENVIYMIKGENKVPGSQDGREAFAELMHRENLAKLPAVWAASDGVKKLERAEVSYTKTQTEEGLKITLDKAVGGEEISYIGIHLKQKIGGEKVALEFGEHRFSFDASECDYLIPVASSPYWKWQEEIPDLWIKGEMQLDTEDVEMIFYQ